MLLVMFKVRLQLIKWWIRVGRCWFGKIDQPAFGIILFPPKLWNFVSANSQRRLDAEGSLQLMATQNCPSHSTLFYPFSTVFSETLYVMKLDKTFRAACRARGLIETDVTTHWQWQLRWRLAPGFGNYSSQS